MDELSKPEQEESLTERELEILRDYYEEPYVDSIVREFATALKKTTNIAEVQKALEVFASYAVGDDEPLCQEFLRQAAIRELKAAADFPFPHALVDIAFKAAAEGRGRGS